MQFDDIYNLTLMVCAILTLCCGVYFWFFPKGLISNKILGVLNLIWSFDLLIFVFQSKDFFIKFPHLFGIGTSLILLFFPLIFLFIKTYLYPEQKNYPPFLLHIIPFVLFWVTYSPFYFSSTEEKIHFISSGQFPSWVDSLFLFVNIVTVIQGLSYSIRSIYILQSYNSNNADKDTVKAKWLQNFIVYNIIMWAIASIGFLEEVFPFTLGFDVFKIYYFGITSMAIWIASISITYPSFFSNSKEESSILDDNSDDIVVDKTDIKDFTEDLDTLCTFFEEEKPYLNSQLSLQDLADMSGFTRNHISEMLNTQLGKSFYDFVNEYRINEFIRLVNNDNFEKKHPLSSLYESSGFNSKATFNRYFKKLTGMTPTVYIQGVCDAA